MAMIVPSQNLISTDVPGADLNSNAAGVSDVALSQLGGQLAQTGLALHDKMVRAEAETAYNNHMAKMTMESEIKRRELLMSSIGGNVVDENGRRTEKTITEAYQEWANEQFHAGQASMPNQLGQDMFREGGQRFFTQEAVSTHAEEFAKRAAYFEDMRDQRSKDQGNFNQNTPMLPMVHRQIDAWTADLHADAKTGAIAANMVPAELSKRFDHDVNQFFVGHLNQIDLGEVPEFVEVPNALNPAQTVKIPYGARGALEEGLAILRNEKRTDPMSPTGYAPSVLDPSGEISKRQSEGKITPTEALKPETKDHRINDYIQRLKALDTKGKTDFYDRERNLTASIHNSPKLSMAWDEASYQKLVATGLQEYKLHPEDRIKVLEHLAGPPVEYELYKLRSNYINNPTYWKGLPEKDQLAIKESAKRDVFSKILGVAQQFNLPPEDARLAGQKGIEKLHDGLDTEIAKAKDSYTAKPLDHIATWSPKVSADLAKINPADIGSLPPDKQLFLQRALDEADKTKKYFESRGQASVDQAIPNTNHMSDILVEKVKSKTQSDSDAVDKLIGIQNDLGKPRYKRFMDQAIDNNQLDRGFRMVTLSTSRFQQQAAYRLINMRGELNKRYQDAYGDDTDLRKAVADLTQPKLNLMYQDSPTKIRQERINDLNEAVVLRAKELMTDETVTGGRDKAAQMAEKFFLGGFTRENIGGGIFGSGSVPVLFPEVANDGHPISNQTRKLVSAYVSRASSLEEMKKVDWVLPRGVNPQALPDFMGMTKAEADQFRANEAGGLSAAKFVEHQAQYGRFTFGEDPNHEMKNPDGSYAQGVYLMVPGYKDGTQIVSVKAEEKGPDGKPRFYFREMRNISVHQQQYEGAKALEAAKVPPPSVKGAPVKVAPLKKGVWGK